MAGQALTLDLERDKESTPAYKARRRDPSFVTFAENAVNGRAGAQLSVRGDGSDCTQVMDGGPVSLTVSVAVAFDLNPPKINPCAEALRIAQIIEPRLLGFTGCQWLGEPFTLDLQREKETVASYKTPPARPSIHGLLGEHGQWPGWGPFLSRS